MVRLLVTAVVIPEESLVQEIVLVYRRSYTRREMSVVQEIVLV